MGPGGPGPGSQSQWAKETWYDVEFSNFALNGDNQVTAKLTIRESGSSGSPLLEEAMVVATGKYFDTIDTVLIGNAGTDRTFDVDDLKLTSGTGN